MDSSEHKKWTGVPNELILKNARIIAARRETRISLPLVAGVNDGPDNLKALAEFALDNRIHHIDMNPLHFLGAGKYKYLGLRSPYHGFRQMEKDEIQQVKDLLETYGLCVGIGRMM